MQQDGNNYGIKVSQLNHDVTSTGDENLIFSSSWGNLPILQWGRIQKLLLTDDSRKLFDHNLGYVPLIVLWQPISGFISIERTLLVWDATSVYMGSPNPGSGALNIDYYYYIFGVDITKPFTAPIIQTGGVSLDNDNDYGIRVAKKGKDVSSTDMRDYAIHSATRSPMLHSVQTATVTTGSSVSFMHALPYNPLFFGFRLQASTAAGSNMWSSTNGFVDMTSTGNTITMTGATGAQFSVVILKDPFSVADVLTEVTI